MQRAFFTRAPNNAELALLKKFLACYRDGSGNHREADGSSRPDSRQIERCLAELLYGKTTENKSYYDFVVECNESGGIAIRGASVKSKEITNLRNFPKNIDKMRSHLEISNSSAKDWRECRDQGLSEDDFRCQKNADKFGSIILSRQNRDRLTSQETYLVNSLDNTNKWFEEKECIFISLIYSQEQKGERVYLLSAFPILLPQPSAWEFQKSRLVGLDNDGGILYEWYALSGSQFKYYPLIKNRANGTNLFSLPKPAHENLRAKAARLFGD